MISWWCKIFGIFWQKFDRLNFKINWLIIAVEQCSQSVHRNCDLTYMVLTVQQRSDSKFKKKSD